MTFKVPTVDELSQLTTHELSDLIANCVLLLRRMPNVECSKLTAADVVDQAAKEPDPPPVINLVDKARERVNGSKLPDWSKQ